MGVPPEKKRADALDRARDLARSLDSMKERLRAAGVPAAQGAEGSPSEGSSPRRPGESSGTGRTSSGGGSPNGARPGGVGGGGRARLGSEDVRQLRREINERAQDAEAIGRALEESGAPSPQAVALAQRLQGLASNRNFKDPLGLAELTGQVANDIKMLEYALRRADEENRPELQLMGSEELPPGYRAMVEEYYRTLARKPRE